MKRLMMLLVTPVNKPRGHDKSTHVTGFTDLVHEAEKAECCLLAWKADWEGTIRQGRVHL
jgi:hypothetical protein